jgi:hypothetical protein
MVCDRRRREIDYGMDRRSYKLIRGLSSIAAGLTGTTL